MLVFYISNIVNVSAVYSLCTTVFIRYVYNEILVVPEKPPDPTACNPSEGVCGDVIY